MINILVTGAQGQVGSEIQELSSEYIYNFFFTTKENLNIALKEDVDNFIMEYNIDIIINTAAYTAVDEAEYDVRNADTVNHQAVKYLAQSAKKNGIKLVHISSDYVFDGKTYKPYTENDSTNPSNVYGKTKLDGEIAMLDINPQNSIIIRTSWVYSSFGNNFVKTMLRLGKEKDSLSMIFDQISTPTYAKDLAKMILDILPDIENEQVEIYNYSNEGVVSWYDFAKEIMYMAQLDCDIHPIETKEYPTTAARAHYSVLNKTKIKNEFGIIIPYWKDSLDKCLKKMKERR